MTHVGIAIGPRSLQVLLEVTDTERYAEVTQRREICRRSSKREIYVSNIRILRTTAQWSQKVTDQKIIGLGERPRTRHETDATKNPKKSKESRVLDPKPHTYSRPAVVLQVALRRQ